MSGLEGRIRGLAGRLARLGHRRGTRANTPTRPVGGHVFGVDGRVVADPAGTPSADCGATFTGAAHEWLRYVEQEHGRNPTTVADYRSVMRAHLLSTFGERPIEPVTTGIIEAWLAATNCYELLRSRSDYLGPHSDLVDPGRGATPCPANRNTSSWAYHAAMRGD